MTRYTDDGEIVFNPPVEADLFCNNCHEPIAAVARILFKEPQVRGCNQYRWLHVRSGSAECPPKPPRYAMPSDWWHATAQIEAALTGRYAAERALEDAADLLGGGS